MAYALSMNFIDNVLIGVDSLDQLKKNMNVLSYIDTVKCF